MGFRENLKAELAYKNILVKELAAGSGINKRTLDNYLREDHCMPPADAAVRIADALGVTVEYLITGRDNQSRARNGQDLAPESRFMLQMLGELDKRDRTIVFNLVKSLKEMEESEKKA